MNVQQETARIMDTLARIDKELDAEEKAKRKEIARRRQQAEYNRDIDKRMKEFEL